jgi:hypothetical protein
MDDTSYQPDELATGPTSPSSPSSGRLSDRPPDRPHWAEKGVVLLLLLLSTPFVLFSGCLFLGWTYQATVDRLHGPLRLEAAVRCVSPDGTIRFEADTDGTVRLVRVATGRVLHQRRIPTDDYRRIEATWRNNRQVELRCRIRYPAMALQREYLWDSQSGVLKDPFS